MRNYLLAVTLLVTGAPSALPAQTASETEQNRRAVTSFHELLNVVTGSRQLIYSRPMCVIT